MSKILAFSGSSRRDSYNQRLVKIAASGAKDAGADVTVINLADYPMPIFNEDFEAEHGMPDSASKLKKLMIEHDGLLIASPEYNSSFSPLLKNTIDWLSRVESEDEPSLSAFQGKYASIMAASPGILGGLRGLVFLRMLLSNISITVLPDQIAVSSAFKAFNDDGTLINPKKQSSTLALGINLANTLDKLKS